MRKGIPWLAGVFIFCIVAALEGAYLALHESLDLGYHIYLHVIGIYIMSLVVAAFVQSLSNILRYLIWKAKGFERTPMMLFFFMVESESIKIVPDLTVLFSMQYPKDILKNETNRVSKKLADKIRGVEKTVLAFIFIVELAAIGVFAYTGNVFLLFTMALSFVVSITVSLVNTKVFHGNIVKIIYYGKGQGVYYLTRQLLTYEVNEPVLIASFIEKEMKGDRDRWMEYFAVNDWEEILFYEILYWEGNLNAGVYRFLIKEWVLPFRTDRWLITPERINLMIIFMHLVMLKKDEELRKYLFGVLDDMLSFENDYEEKLENEMLFYRDMSMYDPNVKLRNSQLFRDIDYIRFYDFYKDAQDVVFSIIADDYFRAVEKKRQSRRVWRRK